MKLNCPSCTSPNTQNINIAYSNSQRENEFGHKTISVYGQSLKPPQATEPAKLGAMAAIVWGASWFIGTMFFEFNGYELHQDVLLWIVVSSALVFLIVALRYLTYNCTTYDELEKEWSRQYVCRRCGEIFLPKPQP